MNVYTYYLLICNTVNQMFIQFYLSLTTQHTSQKRSHIKNSTTTLYLRDDTNRSVPCNTNERQQIKTSTNQRDTK